MAISVPGATEKLGSELFLRNVSGARVFVANDESVKRMDKNIAAFKNFGCHTTHPMVPVYINAACAIGTSKDEIDLFINRLKDRIGKTPK